MSREADSGEQVLGLVSADGEVSGVRVNLAVAVLTDGDALRHRGGRLPLASQQIQ